MQSTTQYIYIFKKLVAEKLKKLTYKAGLFLFFFLSFHNGQSQSTSLDHIQLEVHHLKTIKNLHERAAAWLVYAYKTATTNPKNAAKKLRINSTILPKKYIYRAAIQALTEAEINKVQSKHLVAKKNATKAIQLLESRKLRTRGEQKLLALAYVAFARFSKYTKNENGIKYGYKSLQLATEIDCSIAKAFAHNQIAMHISYFQDDKMLALQHFEKAKALLPLLPRDVYDFLNGFILGNIAKTWGELGDLEKSINYKLELLADERNHHNIELMIVTSSNLGTNYFDQKKFDLAEKYLQKTLDLMEAHHVYTNKGVPLYRMGLVQLEKGNIIQAKTYADAIDFWLIDHRFIGSYLVDFYQLKSELAKADMDFEQAILWLEKAAKEQASIYELASNNNLVELEEKSKFREIQQEKAMLEKEQATIQAQKLCILVIGLLTFLAIFLFCKYKLPLRRASKTILQNTATKTLTNKSPSEKAVDKALKQKITKALKEEELFLSPNLTLRKFATHLDSNTSYVSKTINEGFGKNFNALINEYRIEKVVQFFQSGEHKTYTIEYLYKKAGFKSKSSFQKAFKAKLGVTASYYIDNLPQTV